MPLLQLSTDHINVIKPSNRSPNLLYRACRYKGLYSYFPLDPRMESQKVATKRSVTALGPPKGLLVPFVTALGNSFS